MNKRFIDQRKGSQEINEQLFGVDLAENMTNKAFCFKMEKNPQNKTNKKHLQAMSIVAKRLVVGTAVAVMKEKLMLNWATSATKQAAFWALSSSLHPWHRSRTSHRCCRLMNVEAQSMTAVFPLQDTTGYGRSKERPNNNSAKYKTEYYADQFPG